VREARFKLNADGRTPMAASIRYSPSRDLQARMAVFCGSPTSPRAATRERDIRIPTPVFGAGLIEQIPTRLFWTTFRRGEVIPTESGAG